MSLQRQFVMWAVAAVAGVAVLVVVLGWQHRRTSARWNAFLMGDPHEGSRVFENKGCIHCHSVNGWGARRAPDLGSERPVRAGLNQLVSAMWNCAPRMWQRMREERLKYPSLSTEDMSHLFAFLYTARYVDEPGDPLRGRQLFDSKGCRRCHAIHGEGGKIGPELSDLSGVDTPIVWTQAMWNHVPGMEERVRQLKLPWPKFEGREMNDLLAYIREITNGDRRESRLLPANPERGWELLHAKGCDRCHSLNGRGRGPGPDLGPRAAFPRTLVQFAGAMWNHAPAMWRAMQAQGIPQPTFKDREMADLLAFFATLRYFEPDGSTAGGQRLFIDRGCAQCHGDRGNGTGRGPALGHTSDGFNTINLATALWTHGPQMYRRTRELGVPWPSLSEGDIGDLVTFLNGPREETR